MDNLTSTTKEFFQRAQEELWNRSKELYSKALELGIAKESARFLLPLNTETKLYMHGTIRSWITYLMVRTDPSTQLEHRAIAEECKKIFTEQFPTIAKALWTV